MQQGLDLGDSAPERPPMVGVSTVAKAVIGSAGLLGWAWNQGREGRPLHEASRPALDRGNASHRVLYALRDGTDPFAGGFDPSWRLCMEGVTDWHQRTRAVLLAVEVSMKDPDRRVKGRIDYVRQCMGCEHCDPVLGGVILGDVKTGPLKMRREANLQVGGGYRHLWQCTHMGARPIRRPVCGAEVLAINEAGRHRVIEALANPAMFLRALDWFRDLTLLPDEFTAV